MRKFLADTFAMITFSLVVGMAIEVLVSGMTLGQSLQSRATAVPVNLLTGGLYGRFHDWLIRITRAKDGGWIKRTGVDVLAFVCFQAPLYVVILISTGATVSQIITAVGAATILLTFMGGPYGLYLSFVRRRFGVVETP